MGNKPRPADMYALLNTERAVRHVAYRRTYSILCSVELYDELLRDSPDSSDTDLVIEGNSWPLPYQNHVAANGELRRARAISFYPGAVGIALSESGFRKLLDINPENPERVLANRHHPSISILLKFIRQR